MNNPHNFATNGFEFTEKALLTNLESGEITRTEFNVVGEIHNQFILSITDDEVYEFITSKVWNLKDMQFWLTSKEGDSYYNG